MFCVRSWNVETARSRSSPQPPRSFRRLVSSDGPSAKERTCGKTQEQHRKPRRHVKSDLRAGNFRRHSAILLPSGQRGARSQECEKKPHCLMKNDLQGLNEPVKCLPQDSQHRAYVRFNPCGSQFTDLQTSCVTGGVRRLQPMPKVSHCTKTNFPTPLTSTNIGA